MPRYPLIHRILHWAVALIVLWQVMVGLVFLGLSFDETVATFGKAATDFLYLYHKSFGIVLLILMLIRLGLRLANGKPPYRPPLAPFERRLSRAVHALLYVALIVQPLLGLAATSAGGFPIEFFGWIIPGFLPKTDETRVQVLEAALERHRGKTFYVTEKLDGTSFTAFIRQDEFGICSRNLWMDEADESNVLVRVTKGLRLEEKLRAARERLGFDLAVTANVPLVVIAGQE